MSDQDRLITVKEFVGMLGLTRFWFHDHADDPGMPRRIRINRQVRLSLAECEAYIEQMKKKRDPQAPPVRKGGRPRKITLPPEAA